MGILPVGDDVMSRNRKTIQEDYAKTCAQLSDEILKQSQIEANFEEAEVTLGKIQSEIDRLKRLQLKLSQEYSKAPIDAPTNEVVSPAKEVSANE